MRFRRSPAVEGLAAVPFAVLLLWAACAGADGGYDVPQRSDDELDAALGAACRAAVAGARPVLLELSAGWCPDSRRVTALRDAPAVARELRRWTTVTVNVGRFERHARLREALDVTRIATWVALRPTRCDVPAWEWPQLDRVVLEPVSREPVDADTLADWLRRARGPSSPRRDGPPRAR